MAVNKIRISLTPPHPRLFLFFSVWVVLNGQAYGQNSQEFVSDEVVRLAINQKYDSLIARELYDESKVKRYRFLNFIPSPGYSLLQGPTVSYNLGTVFRFFETKERYRIEKEQIINKYQEKADREFAEYIHKRERVEELRDELEVQEQILELERKLFAIAEAKYQNHEITPTQFIQEEIGFRRKELTLRKKQDRLERLESRLWEYYDQRKVFYANAN